MVKRIVMADDETGEFDGVVKVRLEGTLVSFRNHDGTPVISPKVVVITLTEDGANIDDIAVYDSIEEVGS